MMAQRAREMVAGILRDNHVQNLRWGEEWPGEGTLKHVFYPEMKSYVFREYTMLICRAVGLKGYFAAPCDLDGWVFVCKGRDLVGEPKTARQTPTMHSLLGYPTPAASHGTHNGPRLSNDT